RARALPLLGAALLLAALAVADRRSAWQEFATSPEVPADLARFLDGAGKTYWDGGLPLFWFKLRQPHYWSCVQGSGLMFYRDTALDYDRRTQGLAALNTQDFSPTTRSLCPPMRHPGEDGPRGVAQLAEACRALPDLDSIVLPVALAGAPSLEWRPPVPFTRSSLAGQRSEHLSFHLYRCAELR
ncbi:MAG: hypothetical protein K2X74_05040, partial [Acetobacteraceae bacterium]|nr:hypothetical protein [Acetobacteraceae bacterium]